MYEEQQGNCSRFRSDSLTAARSFLVSCEERFVQPRSQFEILSGEYRLTPSCMQSHNGSAFCAYRLLHRRMLDGAIRRFPGKTEQTVKSRNVLGGMLFDQRRYDDAETSFRRSLDILERAYEREHPNLVQDLNNLALLYRTQCRWRR